MQRLLVRRPAQWSRHLLARSTLRSADALLHATRCQRGDHPSGAATGFSRSQRPPCRSSRFGADGSAGICQSAMPPRSPCSAREDRSGLGNQGDPRGGIVCGVATPSARLPQSVRACRTLCSNCSMSAATVPASSSRMLFGSRASLLSRRMAHGSASLTVGEVGDGAAVTSGSGVRVATGLSQPAGVTTRHWRAAVAARRRGRQRRWRWPGVRVSGAPWRGLR